MKDKTYVFSSLIIFICLFILLDIVIWKIPPMRYFDEEYPYWKEQKDYITEGGKDNEILFMGDSVIKVGILPEIISEKSYNIAIGGTTPVEMYYSLNAYLKNNKPPKKIFMAFSPIHYSHLEWYRTRTVYFHYLTFDEMMEAENIILKDDDLSFYEKPGLLWDDIECFLRFPNKYYLTIRNSKLKRNIENEEKYLSAREAQGKMFFPPVLNWELKYKENEYVTKGFQKRKSIDYYLKQILTLAKANNIEVFIIQMPINKITNESFIESGYSENFTNYMEELSRETDISIEINLPIYDTKLFDDYMHLSKKGAEIYTKNLKEKYNL